ncbi:hypothetical protein ACHAPT_011105 [Fusarium lateritium]
MPSREDWILSQVAPTKVELYAGDGCHLDEAICLINYLDNKMTALEAATAITKPVLQEANPTDELYRLMGLLCEAPVELADDRDKLFDLLATIQALPPEAGIDWADLAGFGHMWSDLFGLHLHGEEAWETEPLSDERKLELCQHFEAIGTAEAEMYMRGLGGVSEVWGYEVLSMICSGRPGLGLLMSQIHAWLKVAGSKLMADMKPDDIKTFTRGRRAKMKNIFRRRPGSLL